MFQWSESPQKSYDLCVEYANKAVMLDSTEPVAHFALGWFHMWAGNQDASEREHKKAISLDPNYALSHAYLAHVTSYLGRPNEAIELLDRAMRLDPRFDDVFLHFLAHAHFMLERLEEAADILAGRIGLYSGSFGRGSIYMSHFLLASTYGHLGKLEQSRATWDDIFRINPKFTFDHYTQFLNYKNPADKERLLDGFAKAGLPK